MSGRLWFPLSASGREACDEPQRRRTWQSPWWRHQTALTGGTEGIAVPPFRTFFFYFIRQFLFYPILSFLLTFKANYLDKSFFEQGFSSGTMAVKLRLLNTDPMLVCAPVCTVQWSLDNQIREVVKKNNGLFTVRLTVRVDPPPYGQGFVIFSK